MRCDVKEHAAHCCHFRYTLCICIYIYICFWYSLLSGCGTYRPSCLARCKGLGSFDFAKEMPKTWTTGAVRASQFRSTSCILFDHPCKYQLYASAFKPVMATRSASCAEVRKRKNGGTSPGQPRALTRPNRSLRDVLHQNSQHPVGHMESMPWTLRSPTVLEHIHRPLVKSHSHLSASQAWTCLHQSRDL